MKQWIVYWLLKSLFLTSRLVEQLIAWWSRKHYFQILNGHNRRYTLHEKCLYSEFFWSIFSRIRAEYGEILCISSYSVWMRENTNQKTSNTDTFYAVISNSWHRHHFFVLLICRIWVFIINHYHGFSKAVSFSQKQIFTAALSKIYSEKFHTQSFCNSITF